MRRSVSRTGRKRDQLTRLSSGPKPTAPRKKKTILYQYILSRVACIIFSFDMTGWRCRCPWRVYKCARHQSACGPQAKRQVCRMVPNTRYIDCRIWYQWYDRSNSRSVRSRMLVGWQLTPQSISDGLAARFRAAKRLTLCWPAHSMVPEPWSGTVPSLTARYYNS